MIRFPFLLRAVVLLSSLGAALASAQTSTAPPPASRAYAVISEVARDVSVVSFQESTGSRMNQNKRERLPVPDGALDKVALITAQQALKKAAPAASVWLIAPPDSDFFPDLYSATVGETVKVPADLAAAFKENRTTHLLLFTRDKAEAQFRFVHMIDSSGPLDGLGFYVDRRTQVKNLQTSEAGVGYLAPYVHIRATLIEAATSKVVGTKSTQASQLFSAGEAKDGSGNPWEALTAAQKMNTLRDMLRDEVTRLTPLVLAMP
jgi:hypothetical protein